MPYKKIIDGIGITLPKNFEISETQIPKLLESADVLIYTSSTTCFEAMAHGIPTVYVGSDLTIELNQLDFDQQLVSCARNPEGIADAVDVYLNMNETEHEEKRAQWKRTVERMFAKVDDSVYSLFFS